MSQKNIVASLTLSRHLLPLRARGPRARPRDGPRGHTRRAPRRHRCYTRCWSGDGDGDKSGRPRRRVQRLRLVPAEPDLHIRLRSVGPRGAGPDATEPERRVVVVTGSLVEVIDAAASAITAEDDRVVTGATEVERLATFSGA